MKLARTGGDIRTWLLLVLALVPTWSVLGGAAWLWNERGDERAEFETSLTSVDATYELFALSNKLFRSEASLRVAALPNASSAVIERAERDLLSARAALSEAPTRLSPLVERLSESADVMRETEVLGLMESSVGLAIDAFDAQRAGEPVGQEIRVITSLARSTAGGAVLPFVNSDSASAVYLYDTATTTIQYYDRFDRDRSAIVGELETTALVAASAEATAALRESKWKDLEDSRTFVPDVAGIDWFSTRRDWDAAVALEATEPLGRLIDDSPELGTAAERDSFFLDLQSIDDALQADVDLAYSHLEQQVDLHFDKLAQERRLTAGTSALMFGLGVALAALTLSEVRRRRRVETAHDSAIAELAEKADRDPTTGVWNRRRLKSEVQNMIAVAPDADEIVVLAYLDLDHFKAINDVWGHSTGDRVLLTVTERLHDFSYHGIPFELCRFGGDEFVLFAQMRRKSLQWLEELGVKIIESVDSKMDIDGRMHEVGVSVGIATSTNDSNFDSLLLEADSSLLLAKQERGTAVVYNREISRIGELVHAFPSALANGEIRVQLQPVLDLATGEIAHAEALARWYRPNGESVSPAVFIPLVESYGLADKLTTNVLRCVRDIINDGRTPASTRIWINVSPRELDVANFAERFVALLYQLEVQPNRIGIEITESAAVRDPDRLAVELRQLREVGVCVAIDDFGNGYSPLGYLRQLPVDIVKLDRSLVSHIDRDVANQHIVVGIVGLVHELGMGIVAEGVERPEEHAWLRDHNVGRVQGFLFGRPTESESFDWRRRNQVLRPTETTAARP